MKLVFASLLVSIAMFVSACGGSPCSNIGGTWGLSGDCGSDVCVISQTGCATNFACGSGSVSYTGSVSGNAVTYSGKTAAGVQGTCNGTLAGNTISGTCVDVNNVSCGFTATRQ